MPKFSPYFLLFSVFLGQSNCFGFSPNPLLANSVVKIHAVDRDNKLNAGSGVVIASDKVATNCHVTRTARKIFLTKSGQRYPVFKQAKLAELDTCILQTEKLPLPSAPLAATASVKTGADITIFGYPYALGIRGMAGKVIHLHHFGDSKIIEINTGFMQGASGGGVFNQDGKLIGLMTFIGKIKGDYHFYVIPANWLANALKTDFVPIAAFSELSFWESGKFEHLALP